MSQDFDRFSTEHLTRARCCAISCTIVERCYQKASNRSARSGRQRRKTQLSRRRCKCRLRTLRDSSDYCLVAERRFSFIETDCHRYGCCSYRRSRAICTIGVKSNCCNLDTRRLCGSLCRAGAIATSKRLNRVWACDCVEKNDLCGSGDDSLANLKIIFSNSKVNKH